ncbi:MAG: WD40 repeat domain-containing protein, partial [Gemmataceae bacterium]
MIVKAIRLVIYLTAMMAPSRPGMLAGEALPPRALARIGDHRLYHGPGITCAALSPDGRRVASAAHYPSESSISDKERDAYDPVIVLWDAVTGKRLCEVRAPQAPIWKIAFSPDSKRLAAYWSRKSAGKKEGVGVFEVETGKLLWQRDDVRDFVSNLSYSSDGKQLWVSELRGPIRVWDLASGKQIRLWKPPPEVPPTKDKEGVCALCGVLSPDAKVVVWEMGLFSRTGAIFNSVAICVHDAATNQRLYQKKLGPKLRNLRSFAFFSDSKRFAADWDNTLTVWETATGKELQALKGPEKVRFALAPDGRHAAIYERDSRFLLLDLATGKPAWVLNDGFGWRASFFRKLSQVFSADGKSLLLATDSTLRLFDTATGKERGMFGHRTAIKPSFSADGRTLFTICAERRCSWDVSRKEPSLLANEPRRERRGEYGHSADDRLFLDGSEHHLRVRERATGRVLRELEDCDHERRAFYGWFSADATRLLVLYYSRNFREKYPEVFWLYDVKTGKASGHIKVGRPLSMGYP